MVVKSLRYPSGEKSDQYSWSTLPCEAPRPNLSVTYQRGYLSAYSEYGEDYTIFKYKPLDFDGFMDKCDKMGAEPILCVYFDSMYQPSIPGQIDPFNLQITEVAVEIIPPISES